MLGMRCTRQGKQNFIIAFFLGVSISSYLSMCLLYTYNNAAVQQILLSATRSKTGMTTVLHDCEKNDSLFRKIEQLQMDVNQEEGMGPLKIQNVQQERFAKFTKTEKLQSERKYKISRVKTSTKSQLRDNVTTSLEKKTSIVQQKSHNVTTQKPRESVLPFKYYTYPLDIDMPTLVKEYKERKRVVPITPINEYLYSFLSDIPHKCKHGDTVNLVLLVKSAIQNFKRRALIRETWGNQTYLDEFNAKVVFVLGSLNSLQFQKLIVQELSENDDIVQIDYKDTYFNNTLKTTGAIRWVIKYCGIAKFIMLVDDDFYVATDSLVKELMTYSHDLCDRLYMGSIGKNVPGRDKSEKWYMPTSEYPYDLYPAYIRTGGMIMSIKVAIDVDIAIRFTKRFKFDDVFIGMVTHKLGIKPIHNPKIAMYRLEIKHPHFHNILASHGFYYHQTLRNVWQFHRQYVQNITRGNAKTPK